MAKDYFPMLSESMADFGVPGVMVALDPLEADVWGAFLESALSEEDAIDSELDAYQDLLAEDDLK
jgi:hypothetical protein